MKSSPFAPLNRRQLLTQAARATGLGAAMTLLPLGESRSEDAKMPCFKYAICNETFGGWPFDRAFAFSEGRAVVATVLQRARYRSLTADRTGSAPGPGGGEIGRMDRGFAPTNEVFTDPTTHLVMRVHMDPRTGERRYFAEGRL